MKHINYVKVLQYTLAICFGFLLGLIIGMFTSVLNVGVNATPQYRTYPTMDSLTCTYTNDKESRPIYIYQIIDPDTGIEYLVSDHGGITPRLGRD